MVLAYIGWQHQAMYIPVGPGMDAENPFVGNALVIIVHDGTDKRNGCKRSSTVCVDEYGMSTTTQSSRFWSNFVVSQVPSHICGDMNIIVNNNMLRHEFVNIAWIWPAMLSCPNTAYFSIFSIYMYVQKDKRRLYILLYEKWIWLLLFFRDDIYDEFVYNLVLLERTFGLSLYREKR